MFIYVVHAIIDNHITHSLLFEIIYLFAFINEFFVYFVVIFFMFIFLFEKTLKNQTSRARAIENLQDYVDKYDCCQYKQPSFKNCLLCMYFNY